MDQFLPDPAKTPRPSAPAPSTEEPSAAPPPNPPHQPQLLFLIFILIASISGVTYYYDYTQRQAHQRRMGRQILAVTDVKVRQVAEWRDERIGNARLLMNNPMATRGLERIVAGATSGAERAAALEWLKALCRPTAFANAIVTDRQGRVVLLANGTYGDAQHIRQRARDALDARDVILDDIPLVSNTPHMGMRIPLRTAPDAPAFGVLMLGIEPGAYLFPLIERWPNQRSSAEVFLVRRDGDAVVYLNPGRFQTEQTKPMRLPVDRPDLPAAMAVRGLSGIVTGVDYRGKPVLAALRRIPDSSWYIEAKIDSDDLGPAAIWSSTMVGLSAICIVLAAAAWGAFLWRRQQVRFYRDRYTAELERRALVGHYDYLTRFANDIILLMDEAGRIIEANDRAVDAYGYRREELIGMNVRQIRAPEELAALEGQWERTGEHGSLLFETLHQRRDGSVMPVEVSSRTVEIQGAVFRQSIIRDITERRRAQLALEQSEARFRKVVESAPEAIIVEREGVIQYANLVALRLLGVTSPSDVVGRELDDFIHPDEREDSRRRAEIVSQRIAVPFVERRYVRPDGEIITAENSAVPIDYDRQPASLIFFRDISERKKNEAERVQLEAQLRQAQKMESIGRLAGGVAHDFNNHLTVINGYCDMLLRDAAADDPVREPLEEIRTAGERASALTQQLLAFSRKQMAEPKPLRLNDVVIEAERMLRRLIGEDIDVLTRLSPDPAVVMADRGQMNQVLMNLAVNARDAMPRGGRLIIETGSAEVDELYVSLHPEAKPGLYATLSVSDSGVGMTPDTLQRIFEPFFTTKATGRGTGLGLATVYGIVKQGGGWIRVYSEVGKGTHFQLFLPCAECAAPEPAGLPDQAGQRGSETVLVVEDQAEVRHLTMAILGKHGYRLLDASDGATALKIGAEYPDRIDLLLTDVVMPGMNGRELADRLVELRPGLKVLYTSGYTAEAIGREGVLEHGVAYLPKPFSVSDLTAKVREVIDSGPSRPAGRRAAV